VLTSLDGKPATAEQLSDVEKVYPCRYCLKRNAPSTMQRYTGRSIIVVSTDKKGRFVFAYDKQLVKLIKASTVV
jgi:hypothetical protein